MKLTNSKTEVVGILGHGEIGSVMAKLCREAGYTILIKEIDYDETQGNKVDYLHVNIPEKNSDKFARFVSKTIKELSPRLTIVNASTTPGTTRKIFELTNVPIVHSPVIGVHPNLYDSIKSYFPKIIGPVNNKSLVIARKHFRILGLKVIAYDNPETSEAAKLLDLVYYAWNIIFCKWMAEVCNECGLNFDQAYTLHNQIYNDGYKSILPNVVRPILVPMKGPIGGHCTIPDTVLFHRFHESRFTKFILNENKRYLSEKANGPVSFKDIQIKLMKRVLESS